MRNIPLKISKYIQLIIVRLNQLFPSLVSESLLLSIKNYVIICVFPKSQIGLEIRAYSQPYQFLTLRHID
jgi:hypothetical protein